MRIIEWDEFIHLEPDAGSRVSMSIGVFDGVHKGHRVLIDSILSARGKSPWIITFRNSPDRVFHPEDYPGDLMTCRQKTAKLASLGIETTVIIDFSQEFGKLSGAVFLDLILKRCALEYLAVGEDFHCGKNMDTGARAARAYLEKAGVVVDIVPPVFQEGSIISSTRIRRAVGDGDFVSAEKMLGHPYVLLPPADGSITENGPVSIPKSTLVQLLPKKGRYSVIFQSDTGEKEGFVDIDENVISWHYSGIVEAITFI